MKHLLTIALLLLAGAACATVDTDPNCLGLYFDEDATFTDLDGVQPFDLIVIHLVLTNPDFGTLHGFANGGFLEGNVVALSSIFANPSSLDGWDDVGFRLSHAVGFGVPTICEPATLLCTITYMYMDGEGGPVHFHLRGSDYIWGTGGTAGPQFTMENGDLIEGCFSTADGSFCATVNSDVEVVATRSTSFGSLKSLYR